MARIKTDAHKRLVPKKRILSNKTIVLIKIATASILFFACSLFFFQNLDLFEKDFKAFAPFPFVFFAGIIWICAYIANLVGHMEDKNLHLADRFDWLYKVVSTIVIVAIIVRCFFFEKPYLSVPVIIITLCVISAAMTFLTPKIIDNDNDEF